MAMDKNGQLYFTFEEIEKRAVRLNYFMNYLNYKSDLNSDDVKGFKSLHRWNRIVKLKGYVYDEMRSLVHQSIESVLYSQ